MDCKFIENNIVYYLEGKIQGDEREKMDKHIRECEKCSKFVVEFSSAWNILTSSPPSDVSSFLLTRLKARIREYEEGRKALSADRPVRLLEPAVYALVMALGLFAGYNLGSEYTKNTTTGESVSEDVYTKVFEELPEGSIGEIYLDSFNEL